MDSTPTQTMHWFGTCVHRRTTTKTTMLPPLDFKDIQEKFSSHFRPWHRSFQFWVRTADIYTGYKVLLSLPLYAWCGFMCGCCLFKNPSGFIFLFVWDFLGVSASSEFREGCAKARGNVGKATWTRGWEDICHVLRPRWIFPQGTSKVFPSNFTYVLSHVFLNLN